MCIPKPLKRHVAGIDVGGQYVFKLIKSLIWAETEKKNWYDPPPPHLALELSGSAYACLMVEIYFLVLVLACRNFLELT